MPHREKFFENSDLAFSSRNRTWEGVESKEDAPEGRKFQDGVDFCLGAIEQLTERMKERKKHAEKHQHRSI